MPPLPDGVVRVRYLLFIQGVHHGVGTVDFRQTVSDIDQAAVDNFSTLAGPAWGGRLGVASSYEGCEVIVGDGSATPQAFRSSSAAGNGSVTDTLMSPQVQGLLVKRGSRSGRRNIGHLYVPDVPEGNVDNAGRVNGPYRELVEGLWDALVSTAVSGLSVDSPVIYSPTYGAVADVASRACSPVVATLRRRLVRRS